MKNYWCGLVAVMMLALAGAGCSKKSDQGLDVSGLEKSFAAAEDSVKNEAQRVSFTIQSEDYAAAMEQLTRLAGNSKLTPEQKQAVTRVMDQLKKQVGATAQQATDAAQKALDDAKKALPAK